MSRWKTHFFVKENPWSRYNDPKKVVIWYESACKLAVSGTPTVHQSNSHKRMNPITCQRCLNKLQKDLK